MSLRSVPKIAFCRYCGTMPMWYRQYHRTWLWFCHARLVVSPSCGLGGSTTGETTFLFTNQRRNGRAFSSLTARGGGLPIGIMYYPQSGQFDEGPQRGPATWGKGLKALQTPCSRC